MSVVPQGAVTKQKWLCIDRWLHIFHNVSFRLRNFIYCVLRVRLLKMFENENQFERMVFNSFKYFHSVKSDASTLRSECYSV